MIAVFMFRAYDTSSWLQDAPIHADKQETEFLQSIVGQEILMCELETRVVQASFKPISVHAMCSCH